MANGRPKKTQEELDREMEDYWGVAGGAGGVVEEDGRNEAGSHKDVVVVADDGDVDMIE